MKVAHRNIPGQALTGRVGTVNYECGEDITRKERGQILSRVPDDKRLRVPDDKRLRVPDDKHLRVPDDKCIKVPDDKRLILSDDCV